DGDGDLEPIDYSEPGPYGVVVESATFPAPGSCQMEHDIFTPSELKTDVTVILAHGFQRSIDDMALTAEHVASWGVRVVTAPLCSNSLISVDHEQNGHDIAALAAAVAPAGALYSGFSAGGLAAFVASTDDPDAIAFVGLDPVDNNGLAAGLAPQADFPVVAAVSEPAMCNDNANFVPTLLGVSQARVTRVVDAKHFDFETNMCAGGFDLACSFCAPAGGEIREAALGLSTAALVWLSGADDNGEGWWMPGGFYFDQLEMSGRLLKLK
ncbi:MAG: hypothetical protein KC468_39105, partial [Myxococcales bacterium]|nr:hypothetical protein [Myxococcales bacterium]